MKRVTIPETLKIKNEAGTLVELPYVEFLNANVWNHPDWRKSKDYADAYNRLVESFDNKKPSDTVDMLDKDFEKWEKIARLEGIPLNPMNGRTISKYAQVPIYAEDVKGD